MKFSDFGLDPKILAWLKDMGYEEPTEVQEKTLSLFSKGKNILWQSQTWTGKTGAFVIPVLNKIDTNKREPQVLILAPTRELAAQIRDEVFEISKHMYMKSVSCFGGLSKRRQVQELKKWPQVVVWTPWRVYHLIKEWHLKTKNIEYFVLDEVDRMLDMWFIESIQEIWETMDQSMIKQVLTYSATLPKEVLSLVREFVWTDYEHIKVEGEVIVDAVNHMFMEVNKRDKYRVLKGLAEVNKWFKILVFTETKRGADDLAESLKMDKFAVDSLHGDMEQRERFKTLNTIKNDKINILVATDVAARGLNMNKVDLVVNYDVPNDPESYVHRIWRTARAGRKGSAIMFVDRREYDSLHSVERAAEIKIERIDEAWNVVKRTDKPSRWRRRWSRNYNKYSKNGRGRGRWRGWRNNSRHGWWRHSSSRSSNRWSNNSRSRQTSTPRKKLGNVKKVAA